MSAPNTNIDKQTRRHRPALWGIGAVGGLAALLFFGYLAVVTEPVADSVNGQSGAATEAPSQ